jgi:hypothetical protein
MAVVLVPIGNDTVPVQATTEPSRTVTVAVPVVGVAGSVGVLEASTGGVLEASVAGVLEAVTGVVVDVSAGGADVATASVEVLSVEVAAIESLAGTMLSVLAGATTSGVVEAVERESSSARVILDAERTVIAVSTKSALEKTVVNLLCEFIRK